MRPTSSTDLPEVVSEADPDPVRRAGSRPRPAVIATTSRRTSRHRTSVHGASLTRHNQLCDPGPHRGCCWHTVWAARSVLRRTRGPSTSNRCGLSRPRIVVAGTTDPLAASIARHGATEAPATGSTRTGRRDPPRTARARAQHRRRPAELAAVRAVGRSTIGVRSRRDEAPGAIRPQPSRRLVVGRRGATLGADRSRLCRRGVRPLRGAAASGMPGWPRLCRKELTADATIAPARRDEQPGHLRSVRGWRYENRRSCQQSCCRHARCIRRRHSERLCA